ncbi:MAG: YhgE/Pip family protein [Candidatus Nanopelagicales bacterium]
MRLPVPASRLARYELRRFRGPLPRAALIFVMLVPVLYGAIYLSASWDPYGRLGNLPVAVVNADVPTTFNGQEVAAGADFVSELQKGAAFQYHDVDAAQAQQGLRDGDFYLVVSVPAEFSANLVSGAGDDPQRARVDLYRNDANGFVVGTITGSAQTKIAQAVNEAAEVAYFNAVFANLHKIRAGMESAEEGATALATGLGSAHDGAKALRTGTKAALAGSTELSAGASSLASGLEMAKTGSASLAGGLGELETGTSKLSAGAADVADGTQQLNDEVVPALDDVLSVMTQVQKDAAALDKEINEIRDAVGTGQAVDTGLQSISAALTDLAAANPDLADQIAPIQATLATAQAKVTTVSDTVDGALDRLTTLTTRVQDTSTAKVKRARDGIVKLNEGAHEVAAGAAKVATNTAKAASGATELAAGIAAASAGADKLSAGTGSLQRGAKEVDSGTSQLSKGLGKLQSGGTALQTGLADGVKRIPALSGEQQNGSIQVLAAPADVQMTVLNPANFYGRGLAPMFFSIALWVFGISVFLVVRPITGRALAGRGSPIRLALTAWLPIGGIAVTGGLLMVLIVWATLGLDPVHPWLFLGLLVLAACAFSAIAHLLRTALREVGTSILLVVLILQLSSTGGTYPTPLLPGFFAAISPFMPMTYLIDAFRVTISGGEMSRLMTDLTVLTGILVAAQFLVVLVVRHRQRFSMEDLHPTLEAA